MRETACVILAGLLLAGAVGYLLFGADKGVGIFLVLIAAVLARVLVINIGGTEDGGPDDHAPR